MTNNIDNTFIIGDVHGCYHTLMALVKKLPRDAKLIFVGDLCDKGDFSKDVIEFVKSNNYPCVKGNHEHLFEKYIIDAIEKDKHSAWSSDKRYGGLQCIQSYKGDIKLIKEHLKWIKKLPTYIQIDKYFITHGFGLEYYDKKDDPDYYNDFLLNRIYKDTVEPEVQEDIINIFGHCVFDEVKKGKKYICLDTGCSNGGKLSALELKTQKIYQEPMDKRDSSYILKELKLKDIDTKNFTLDDIKDITLDKSCRYNNFDVVSNEILEYIVNTFLDDGYQEVLNMKERSVIFPKQLNIVKIINTES
ncbi:MAG: metallophosphoesterase [Campylobacterota bacterium]|nr:metallophosphoesterase [Campylobacterota bacterium]